MELRPPQYLHLAELPDGGADPYSF